MSQYDSSKEMGFTSWLLLLFIAFKLAGIIDWSWWWVLSPVWIILLIVVIAVWYMWVTR